MNSPREATMKYLLFICFAKLFSTAQAVELHVSPSGDDTYAGTQKKPLATLIHARDVARELKVNSGTETITIVIHGGTYTPSKTIELLPEDSGIVWQAAEGEKVIISGGRRITGQWKRSNDAHIWVVEVPEAKIPALREHRNEPETYSAKPKQWNFRQLYVNGERATRARFPNDDAEEPFLYAKSGAMDRVDCYPGKVKTAWADAPDAQINIVAGWRFFNQRNDVTRIDLEANALYIGERERHAKLKKNNWFWVEGVLEELDQPGEWYLDTDEGLLYFWPKNNQDPNDLEIIAPYLNRLFYLKGDVEQGTHVKNVSFKGIDFRHTTYTMGHIEARVHTDCAIKFNNVKHSVVTDCTFKNIGGYGVWLHLDSTYNRFEHNTITQAGGGGILLTGARLSYMDDTKVYTPGDAAAQVAPLENIISDNEVSYCGLYRYYGGGVHADSRPASTAMDAGNIITHNYFHHLSRNGIFAFRNQGGNLIAYNRIDEAMSTTMDGGAIHIATMNKLASPSYFIGNIVSNIWGMDRSPDGKGKRHIARGIYFDWFSSSNVIRDNISYNTWDGGYAYLGGNNNLCENNIIVMDSRGMNLMPTWHDSKTFGNIERNNIVLAKAKDVPNGPCVDPANGDFTFKKGYKFPDGFHPERFTTNGLTQQQIDATIALYSSTEARTNIGGVISCFDDAVKRSGNWEKKQATGMWGLFKYNFLKSSGKKPTTITFPLSISESGEYGIYLYFQEQKNLAQKVPVTITHAKGKDVVYINQRESGNWPKIGSYTFKKGQDAYVTILSKDAKAPVAIDSVGFIKLGND